MKQGRLIPSRQNLKRHFWNMPGTFDQEMLGKAGVGQTAPEQKTSRLVKATNPETSAPDQIRGFGRENLGPMEIL